MIHEKTVTVFKDIRFWLVLGALLLLAWIALSSYPA